MAKRTMATMKQDRPEIERLKTLVEIYGGERERWPAAERLQMSRLVAADAQAAEIVAEAEALDRLLDTAPALNADRLSDLTSRIVASAQAEGRWQGEGLVGSVADVPEVSTARLREGVRDDGLLPSKFQGGGWRGSTGWTTTRRGPLASAAMLAASLVFGVFIGLSAITIDIMPDTQVVADAGDDSLFQQLVTGEDNVDALVEELL